MWMTRSGHVLGSISPSTWLAVVAVLVAAASMWFAGRQAKMAAEQTKLAIEQNKIAAEQHKEAAEQTRLMRETAQLSFNLEVMTRLGDVLMIAADDKETHSLIWKTDGDKTRRPQVAGQNILDVICMALKAVRILPGFQVNDDDWSMYAEYVMTHSPHLRREVLDNEQWWPEIVPFARTAAGLPE
jgi:hypothetical protein